MIPTDDAFVKQVAKSIGKDRLFRESMILLESVLGYNPETVSGIDNRFDQEFEVVWADSSEDGVWNREQFAGDALAAINKINLMLLTMS